MILEMMSIFMKLKNSPQKLEVATLGPPPLVAIRTMTLGGQLPDGRMGGIHGDGHHGSMDLTPVSPQKWTFFLI